MIASTDPIAFVLSDVPVDQKSCKMSSLWFAFMGVASAPVRAIMDEMRHRMHCLRMGIQDKDLRADIRYWPNLKPGQYPGLSSWHYDLYNDLTDPRGKGTFHMLFFSGAGCETEFENKGRLGEDRIHLYGWEEKHRITPATLEGPRLLIRMSYAPDMHPRDKFVTPNIFDYPREK